HPGRTGEDLLARPGDASRPRPTSQPAPPARPARTRTAAPGHPTVAAPSRSNSVAVGMRSPLAARFARLRRPGMVDYLLLLTVVALLLLGLVMVYSASQFAVPGDPGYWFRHQAIWEIIGIAALIVTSRIDYHLWRKVALPGMGLCVALLLLVLIAGHTAYGAQRWLSFGLFSFQPSELAKLALAIYVADWLVRKGDAVRSLRNGLLPFAVLTGIVLGLILLQNDLGTSLVVAVLALTMFYAAGANLLQLVPTLALGTLAAVVLAAGTSFRRARLDAFLHPLPPGCASAGSYQVCQGLISLGSGGIFGRGLGDSVQKAGYLPNPFTDSIFAVTGEELGLLGCALIVFLFGLLAFRGLRIGRRVPDAYGSLLACGITCWLIVQAAVNIGSVVDAIPFTGVPLPFVSYGGSSLATSLAAVGVLLNISRHTSRENAGSPRS
ncbi:MAG TPA: putative lipid II flippase FtsW, partial [Ktedonobacterales bacterium]|nr:putative lipid II flippase FtsW [Ktedonobacterales bacterium]